MSTYQLVKRDGMLYVEGLKDWLGHEPTLLGRRNDYGEGVFPDTWGEEALSCLYDERQTNENIKDGDEFEFLGRVVARVEGFHVVAVIHGDKPKPTVLKLSGVMRVIPIEPAVDPETLVMCEYCGSHHHHTDECLYLPRL